MTSLLRTFTVCNVAPAALLTRCFVLISAASDVFMLTTWMSSSCVGVHLLSDGGPPPPTSKALGIRPTGQTFCPIRFIHDQVEPVATSRGLPADVTLVVHPVVKISLVN